MNACLPLTLAKALTPMAPPSSIVHRVLDDAQCREIDAAMLRIKQDPRRQQKLADKLTQQEIHIHALTGGIQ